MNNRNLTALVIKAQNGDKQAMNDLVADCYNDIYYYVLKTVKKEDLAADVTQESFLEIITTLGKLREPEAFPLWARRIAYHKCALHFRNSKEVLLEENEEGETLLDRLPDESEDALPEQALEDREFRKTIMDMINSLPSEQTNALLLYYYEKLSVGEIAEIQGTTAGTVKSRLNYARKAIKGKVEEYEKKTGTKLHGIAILPLLLRFTFGSELSAMPVMSAPASLLAGAASATGAGATAAGTAVAGGAAKAVGMSLAAKIVGGVVAASVLIGGTAFGISKLTKKADETDHDFSTQESSFVSESVEAGIDGISSEGGEHSREESEVHDPYEDLIPSEGLALELKKSGNAYTVVGIGSCTDTEIVIPKSYNGLPVTDIREMAFHGEKGITSVVIPNNMTTIGEMAFDRCTNLTSVSIPESITRIKRFAFRDCESLTNVTIPDSVTIIEGGAFSGCKSLTDITIPDSVTTLGGDAFSLCTSLTDMVIPENITTFGSGTFYECSSLKTLTIPASMKEFPAIMCQGCINLTDIYYNGTMEQWLEIGQALRTSDLTGEVMFFSPTLWYLDTGEFTVHCTDGDLAKADVLFEESAW